MTQESYGKGYREGKADAAWLNAELDKPNGQKDWARIKMVTDQYIVSIFYTGDFTRGYAAGFDEEAERLGYTGDDVDPDVFDS